jgi:hypothetical protein
MKRIPSIEDCFALTEIIQKAYYRKSTLYQKKELRLLAEINALEWLQVQLVVMTLGISNNNNGPTTTALGT